MIRQRTDICDSIFYMLGVFATIQLLSFAGVTVFNLVLIITVIISFLINKNRLKMNVFFILSFVSTLITLLLSLCNKFMADGFKRSAFVGGITYLLILIIYLIMNTKVKYADGLLKGFQLSCKFTLGWCMLQLLLYHILHVDLNILIFNNILKNVDAKGDYVNGILIPSGFYSHRAILIPSLIFLFFMTSSFYMMALILLIGCLTRSTALIIGLFMALIFRMGIGITKNLCLRIKEKKIIVVALIFFLAIIGFILLHHKIIEVIEYVIERFVDTTSNEAGNSSVVHFLYYKNLGFILQQMDVKNILFGTGFGTSGQHYTWFNGQYSDLNSWVVESDYINILLNQGIVGLLLWAYSLIKLIVLSKQYKFWENIAFALIITLVGIMYNIQFTWVIVIELGILVLAKNRVCVFNIKERKGETKV